jgi:hypothetical protein
MSDTDPRADMALVDWSDLGASELGQIAWAEAMP